MRLIAWLLVHLYQALGWTLSICFSLSFLVCARYLYTVYLLCAAVAISVCTVSPLEYLLKLARACLAIQMNSPNFAFDMSLSIMFRINRASTCVQFGSRPTQNKLTHTIYSIFERNFHSFDAVCIVSGCWFFPQKKKSLLLAATKLAEQSHGYSTVAPATQHLFRWVDAFFNRPIIWSASWVEPDPWKRWRNWERANKPSRSFHSIDSGPILLFIEIKGNECNLFRHQQSRSQSIQKVKQTKLVADWKKKKRWQWVLFCLQLHVYTCVNVRRAKRKMDLKVIWTMWYMQIPVWKQCHHRGRRRNAQIKCREDSWECFYRLIFSAYLQSAHIKQGERGAMMAMTMTMKMTTMIVVTINSFECSI